MRTKRFINALAASGGLLLISAQAAFAQISLSPTGQFTDLGDITFASMIAALIRIVLVIAAIVFFFILVIGGIRWILSGGDKAATEAARGQITAALVGLVIVFAAWAIIQLVNVLFGIDILSLTIPSFQP